MLQSYNAAICESIGTSIGTMFARIENSLATQYRDIMDKLNDGDQRKRKTPNDTNGLNAGASSFMPQSTTTTTIPSSVNVLSSNELEPPVEIIKPKPFRSFHQIYVSKFKNDTTAERIIQHVINKSTIKNRELFSVELMAKPNGNVQKLSYVSFKITTCSESVYEAILKEDVWAPNFKATAFSKQKSQTKYANENKPKQLNSQTPVQMNSRRNEKSGASSRKRRVKFNDNRNSNQQNGTPRSSRVLRSSNSTPAKNLPSGNHSNATTIPTQMHGNVSQPNFFGIPGQSHNIMQPMYYPVHQQQMFHQPLMYRQQQQRTPIQPQQRM